MASQRYITKSLRCTSCQQWILRSFIAGIGAQSHTPSSAQRRSFSSAVSRRDEVKARIQQDVHALNEFNNEVSPLSEAAQESFASAKPIQDSPLPWYLQVQQPVRQHHNPLSDRQRLPDLPDKPPTLLQPLLEHVSVELGMDDLSLLDLRSLDPPPALGANLIMIIGTARSEKHLHVSADRLCRWLRTEYKLSPYADGLLGRNELKIKMRRKAKRSKLLSAVGAKDTADAEIDDGIRTGWVCVNLGRVQGGELSVATEKLQRDEDIIGFGSSVSGTSLVVQLLTEEKRGEIDLERLWTDTLSRANRKKSEMDEEEVTSEGVVVQSTASDALPAESTLHSEEQVVDATSRHYYPSTHMANSSAGQQLRAYHTSARRSFATAETNTSDDLDLMIPGTQELAPNPSIAELRRLLAALKDMPTWRAFESLGTDLLLASQQLHLSPAASPSSQDDEVCTTPFLASFYAAMPAFPTSEHWHVHISLLAHARQLGLGTIHSPVLTAQLKNMQIAGLIPSEETFKLVIRSALSPLGKMHPYDGTDRMPNDGKMADIFSILEDMEACGYDPVSADILEMLYQACIGPPARSQTYELGSIVPALGAARLRRHVQADDLAAFWRTWRSYPQRFLPRTGEMYVVLFEAVAGGRMGKIREAREIVRTGLEEMGMEEPAVRLEERERLARAVTRAIEFIEPGLKDSKGGAARSTEWWVWYERAQRAFQRSAG